MRAVLGSDPTTHGGPTRVGSDPGLVVRRKPGSDPERRPLHFFCASVRGLTPDVSPRRAGTHAAPAAGHRWRPRPPRGSPHAFRPPSEAGHAPYASYSNSSSSRPRIFFRPTAAAPATTAPMMSLRSLWLLRFVLPVRRSAVSRSSVAAFTTSSVTCLFVAALRAPSDCTLL